MKFALLVSLITLAVFGCTTEQKHEKKWDVKVSTPKVWVFKADGSRQCEPNSALITQDDAMSQLRGAGVTVQQARAGNDGMMHTALCGSATGNTIEVQISRVDLDAAKRLGFSVSRHQDE